MKWKNVEDANQIVFDLRSDLQKELIVNCKKINTFKKECVIYEEQPQLIYSQYVKHSSWRPSVHKLNEHELICVVHTIDENTAFTFFEDESPYHQL